MAEDDGRYVALIGDIRGSRQADDRAELQERFREAVERANRELEDHLGPPASPLTVTAGDEFQALFRAPAASIAALRTVSDEMAPRMLRFGLGCGPLETDLNEEQAIGMDGPCLRRAREALEVAKARDGWVRLGGFGESRPLDRPLGHLRDPVGALRARWTARQAEIVRTLRRRGGTQKDVAEALDIAPSTVSEALQAAQASTIRDAEHAAIELLEAELDGGGPR
jgi:hypothetical protein